MKTETNKRWMSPFDECDICHGPIKNHVPWFVDGMTKQGPWGLMCPKCFKEHGVKIAYGFGQKYNGKTGKLMAGGYVPSDLEKEIEGYEP